METFHIGVSTEHNFWVLKIENTKLIFTKSWIPPKSKLANTLICHKNKKKEIFSHQILLVSPSFEMLY